MGDAAVTGRTGWVYHDDFLRHNSALTHPERPERLSAVREALESQGILRQLQPLGFSALDDDEILRVHTRRHLAMLDTSENRFLDPDTFVGVGSPSIARLAAGGVAAAARAVWNGEVQSAFCAVRPPGHHALADRAMGFCLLNNVAIAARAIQADTPGARVMILDWDVHHGNGTQAIFYEDASVLYASVHQYPYYPGTGTAGETGRGDGRGFTANAPLPAGAGDTEFLDAIHMLLDIHGVTFGPDILLISCGFDPHRLDPLGGLEVSTEAFGSATRLALDFAAAACDRRVVSVLEGGYSTAALADAVTVHIQELMTAAACTTH